MWNGAALRWLTLRDSAPSINMNPLMNLGLVSGAHPATTCSRGVKTIGRCVPNGLRWTVEEYAAFRRRMDGLAPPLPLPLRPYTQPFDRFLELCAAAKLPIPAREVLFLPDRDFRFDYAWPCAKVAVEQQGFRDHSTRKGLQRDYEKLNLAQLEGFIVLQFTPKQLQSIEAIDVIRRALTQRSSPDQILGEGK
jgi:hypothetical protein